MRQDVESFGDFCQYYTGSFVKGRQPDELFYIDAKLDDRHVVCTRYVHGRKQDTPTISWDQLQTLILFGLPRTGMVAFKDELLFFYYRTTRNGSRGYDPERIAYRSFNEWDLRSVSRDTVSLTTLRNAVFVHNLLRHSHVAWSEAVADLLSEKPKSLAVALSYNFGAYIPRNFQNPILCYKSDRIGSIVGPNTIQLVDPQLNHYHGVIRKWVNPSMEFQVVT